MILKYRLVPGETLTYLVKVTLIQPPEEEYGEITLELPVEVLGPEWTVRAVPRILSSQGSMAATYLPSFREPVQERRIDEFGRCLDQPGLPSPPFLPRFLEEDVEADEGWDVREKGPDGDLDAEYVLAELDGDVAKIVVRRTSGPRAMEGLIRFSVSEGLVLQADTHTEVQLEPGSSVRLVAEYRLQL